MLEPIQNHALRLCLGAFRTSPASSLCAEANEPPLYLRRKKLSLQYAVKISSCSMNPTVKCVFKLKSKRLFARKVGNPHRLLRLEYELLRTWVVLVLAIKTARYALFHLFFHGCYVALVLIMTCMHSTKTVSVQKFYRIILQKPRIVLASMWKYTPTVR